MYIINFLIRLLYLLWTHGIIVDVINFKEVDLNRGIRLKAAKDIIAIFVRLELHTIQTELKIWLELQILLIILSKWKNIFSYVLILTLYANFFGCTTTKRVGKIVLVFVNGNILNFMLIRMIFVLMIIEIRIKCLTVVKKGVVIYTIDFFSYPAFIYDPCPVFWAFWWWLATWRTEK